MSAIVVEEKYPKAKVYTASTQSFGTGKDCIIMELFGNAPMGTSKYYNDHTLFPEHFRITFHEGEVRLYDSENKFIHKITYEDTGFYITEAFLKLIAVPVDPETYVDVDDE